MIEGCGDTFVFKLNTNKNLQPLPPSGELKVVRKSFSKEQKQKNIIKQKRFQV